MATLTAAMVGKRVEYEILRTPAELFALQSALDGIYVNPLSWPCTYSPPCASVYGASSWTRVNSIHGRGR